MSAKHFPIIVTIIFSLLCLFTVAQNVKKLDDHNGFRSFIFETTVTAYSDMQLLNGNDQYQYYKYKYDTLSWGNYPLKSITYGFYNNKLYWISVEVAGYANSRGVLRIMEATYGSGKKFNEYSQTYGWEGAKVKMAYNEDTFNKNAIINIWSQPIADLINAQKRD